VSDRIRALLEQVVEVTQARYAVGKAVQADVMRAQSELLMIANERFDLERTRDEATARLNGLLDRPAAAPLPPTSTPPPLAAPRPPSRRSPTRRGCQTRRWPTAPTCGALTRSSAPHRRAWRWPSARTCRSCRRGPATW